MKAFLRMKHWQIFLLIFAFPLIGGFAAGLSLVFSESITTFLLIIGTVNVVSMSFLITYQYTLVRELARRYPLGEITNMSLFKICTIIPVLAVVIVYSAIGYAFTHLTWMGEMNYTWMLAVLPISLISMAASIYVMNTMAKALVTVEQQRKVTFSDYVVEFILFWFFFIGVFILQPRINKIFEEPGQIPSLPSMPPPIISNR